MANTKTPKAKTEKAKKPKTESKAKSKTPKAKAEPKPSAANMDIIRQLHANEFNKSSQLYDAKSLAGKHPKLVEGGYLTNAGKLTKKAKDLF